MQRLIHLFYNSSIIELCVFQPLAVTIMFGLDFATLLTLLVVSVLFALFYDIYFTCLMRTN